MGKVGMTAALIPAVAYIRCSDQGQDLETQRRIIRPWAEKHGYVITAWYEDYGKRHRSEHRPEFQRLLSDVKDGVVKVVIIEAKMRFGTKAKTSEFGHFVYELQRAGCQLWEAAKNICYTSGDMVSSVMAAVDDGANWVEVAEKARRSIKGKLKVAEQGHYTGGHVPFGYDVVCRDKDGREKYRLVFEGRGKRVRIDPDGTTTRYDDFREDGRLIRNVPGRDETDTLEYAKSKDRRKLDLVKEVFRRFAAEKVSYRRLARDLQDSGIRPTYSDVWIGGHIEKMLKNRIYIGQPTWNKHTHGAYLTFRDGEYQEIPRDGVKPMTGWKPETDWTVAPRNPDLVIIDDETWETVQKKLGRQSPSAPQGRAPKNDLLWLAGFIYCGHCGIKMEGWAPKTRPGREAYLCTTYRKTQQKQCAPNRLRVTEIESVVDLYLGKAQEEAMKISGFTSLDPATLVSKLGSTWWQISAIQRQMFEILGIPRGTEEHETWNEYDLMEAYRAASTRSQDDGRLQVLEDDRNHLMKLLRVKGLTEKAQEELAADIAKVEAEMDRLRAESEPLDERLEKLLIRFQETTQAIQDARRNREGRLNLARAEALGKIVRRIDCFFAENKEYVGGPYPSMILTKVLIHQVDGPTWEWNRSDSASA